MRAGVGAGGAVKRIIVNLLKTVVAAAIYAAIFWYSFSITDNSDRLTTVMIGLISLGIAYGVWTALFKVVGELAGGIMVLAEFLNRHLLEPQKQRLLRQGREQAMAEADNAVRARLSEARSKLEEQGLDPDDFLPLEEGGEAE